MGSLKDSWRGRRLRSRFELLIAPHVDALYRLAFRLTGSVDAAEDLVQEALIKLYRVRDRLPAVEQVRPWAARVLYRSFVDNWRRQRTGAALECSYEDVGEDRVLADPQLGPEDALAASLRVEVLDQALASLSADHRELLMLHDVEGYSLVELVTVLDVPLGTLKSRLHRARRKLRARLGLWPADVAE